MPEGERETTFFTTSGRRPQAIVRDHDVELCGVTDRRSSFRASPVDDEAPPPASFYGAVRGPVMFHTGPLTRSPAAAQFSSMSGPLYGGRNRGTPTPPPLPLLLPAAGERQRGKAGTMAPEEAGGADGWVNDRGRYAGSTKGNLLDSGQLAMCSNPYCTTCPGAYHTRVLPTKSPNNRLHNVLYGDARSWARKYFSLANTRIRVMNPHTKFVQQWNKFFVISCLVAIFIDPLFFFVLSVNEGRKCIVFNTSFAIAIAVVRSLTDFIYLLHMLLQFRLAYVSPESRVVGTGDFVIDPKKIALHYLRGYFLLDLFVVLPLPQVMILVVIPAYLGASAANYAKNLLRTTVLLQYVPRIIRVLPLLVGQSSSGFIFESAWANFVINLLTFILAGHVVGSCWYLFGLQRVNKCLRDACSNETSCAKFVDCGYSSDASIRGLSHHEEWEANIDAFDCLLKGHFKYGIYEQAAMISTKNSIVARYIYSLFWGFQQISTLAGNQIPSDFVWEVLFTMSIIGLGLLLFALLIGNMQNFLQALGKRRLEMQLRQRDVERWMSHRRLPEDLRRKIRKAERFNWAATRGVNEVELLEYLPENLQRDIRCHLFTFLNKVRIFHLMDEPILEAFRERLRQKLYIAGSYVQHQTGPIERMVFIVRGKMESIGIDGNAASLSEGDVCGEELLAWYLEHSSINRGGGKIRFPGQRLFSNRTVKCITNVEAFALRSGDLEDVTAHFSNFLRKPRVLGAIRYESAYWRALAATHIQVVWRYRKWRLRRAERSGRNPTS